MSEGKVIQLEAANDQEARFLKELGEAKPIVVTLNAQEIGMLWAGNVANGQVTTASQREFMQYLLKKFREAGVPIEGKVDLKLAHGKVVKMKQNPQPGLFAYCWLPENYWASIQAMGGLN